MHAQAKDQPQIFSSVTFYFIFITLSTKSAAAPEDHQVSSSRWLTCPKDQTVSLSPVLESQVYAVGQ